MIDILQKKLYSIPTKITELLLARVAVRQGHALYTVDLLFIKLSFLFEVVLLTSLCTEGSKHFVF